MHSKNIILPLFLLGVLGALIIIIIVLTNKKESFTQGYDAPIAGCIKQCELYLLQRNPHFVQLQEGGRMTQNYCRMMCASEYNKDNKDGCRIRNPSYTECPHKRFRYNSCI